VRRAGAAHARLRLGQGYVRLPQSRMCRLTLALAFAVAGSAGADAGSLVPGNAAALDRVAFAIDGAESSHGADVKMWRPERDGPQGPMQVSAAAAADVGGGDRFDPSKNKALGRAYLARLYRRYANWADAIAAYNWGPGQMDAWIESGRPIDKFPAAVALYRIRVLFAATPSGRAFAMPGYHMQPRRPLADRLHPSRSSIAVGQLYTAIMRDSAP
jgi:transglycosylase-like protein with SLT domain